MGLTCNVDGNLHCAGNDDNGGVERSKARFFRIERPVEFDRPTPDQVEKQSCKKSHDGREAECMQGHPEDL